MAGTKRETNLCGMAGEFLTAGKLLKHGLLVAVTMGNAKAIDLLVHNEKTGKHFCVQVKTMRERNTGWFMGKPERNLIYVFVILNAKDGSEEYFIVKGSTLEDDLPRFFGPTFDPLNPKGFDGVSYKPLAEGFRDKWEVFDS